jgi:hypothetical protein
MSKILCVLAIAWMQVPAFAHEAHEAKGPDAQAIDSACAPDAATAGCGTEKVGTGLLKCLHAYKKAHKDYKFTPACEAAKEKARADHHAK